MEAELLNLGNEIRRYFIAKKTKQIGRAYRPSPRIDTKENWAKAAIKCEYLDANPEIFVDSVFKYGVGKDHGGPYVNHLYSKVVDKAYRVYLEEGNVEEKEENYVNEELSSARDQIVSAIKFRDMTPEEYLLLDIVPIRPVIRLFLLPGSKKVWNKFCDRAKIEMMNDPFLEKTLKTLKFDVDKLYEFYRYS
jgi:hypothetical protein